MLYGKQVGRLIGHSLDLKPRAQLLHRLAEPVDDGYSFVAFRFHRLLLATLRDTTRPLPARARHAVLSVGSAGMLPATMVLWLGMEIVGFALMYEPGLVGGWFALAHHLPRTIGSAFYLSGSAISSLFVGPPSLLFPEPLAREKFAAAYTGEREDGGVGRFCDLVDEARSATGLAARANDEEAEAYERYLQWLKFDHRNRVLLPRIAHALGYEAR